MKICTFAHRGVPFTTLKTPLEILLDGAYNNANQPHPDTLNLIYEKEGDASLSIPKVNKYFKPFLGHTSSHEIHLIVTPFQTRAFLKWYTNTYYQWSDWMDHYQTMILYHKVILQRLESLPERVKQNHMPHFKQVLLELAWGSTEDGQVIGS
jgi:hypothetical protein